MTKQSGALGTCDYNRLPHKQRPSCINFTPVAAPEKREDGWVSVDNNEPSEELPEGKPFWCHVVPRDGRAWPSGATSAQEVVMTYRNTASGKIRFNCGALCRVAFYYPLPAPPEASK